MLYLWGHARSGGESRHTRRTSFVGADGTRVLRAQRVIFLSVRCGLKNRAHHFRQRRILRLENASLNELQGTRATSKLAVESICQFALLQLHLLVLQTGVYVHLQVYKEVRWRGEERGRGSKGESERGGRKKWERNKEEEEQR